jgi:formylglycine-generating enzyme required for sulfatase activity
MRIYLLSLLILLFGLIPFSSLAVEYPQIDNINDYYGEEPYVFETSSSSWFVLNNEKKYEKWGIVEQADYLDALTTYNGKYALVGGAIYRFDNGWHSTSITVNSFSRPSNGVYIIDKCGKAIKTTDFSPANNSSVIAVALITDKMAAMISKKNVLGNENVWNSSGENIPVIWGESGLVNGVMQTAANGSNAIPGAVVNDFAGYNNTRLINQALNNPENSAVMMASKYAFENGIHGYLPAFGELGEVKNNLSDINNALALIGGRPLDGLYWTSSQHYLNYRAWWIQLGTGHDNNQHFAALRNNHTPLSATYYNACYALLRPFGKLPDFTFDNPYPETPFHTPLLGDVNNDGYLDIDDVSTLIDYLLTRDESKLDLRNADCEIDGIINIEDVTALIDFILHRFWPWETKTFKVNGVSFKMIKVQGGTFMMGASTEQATDAESDERPLHQVTLSTYGIGQTEVTQELWLAVMGNNPSYHKGDLNLPVEYISWNDCQEFIERLNSLTGENFRLPTEAEWEFAARGGQKSNGFKYSGSDNISDVAWHNGNASDKTHKVAIKKANELGIYDMSGNVSEWSQDWYGNYTNDAQIDPSGSSSGTRRVNRGGSWYDGQNLCRVTNREAWNPSTGAPFGTLGLRLAIDIEEEKPLMLSTNDVTLVVGSQCDIDILNGSGNYSINGNDSIVTATINGSRLIVTGNHIGSTTIYVCDNYSNSKVALTVTVIDSMLQSETFNVNGVSFTMIAVEGGTFIMGATSEQGTSEAWSSEYPTHQVTVDDFKIGETQVTQALWVAVMGSNPSRFTGNSSRPVDQVTWNECMQFISKLNEITGRNFRLPTEGEWEFAARGGNQSNGYKYAGSNDIGTVAWYSGNANSTTHPVSQKLPNELGLFDMSGNLYDWCSDWYGDYNEASQINPKGPSTGTAKVSRGGCWYGNARYCRVSHRRGVEMTSGKRSDQGLRLAL